MRDLPGLYWDSARQRYFPEASRPKVQTPTASLAQGVHESHPIRCTKHPRLPDAYAAKKRVSQASSKARREEARRAFISFQIATTSSCAAVHVPIVYSGPITAFSVSQRNVHRDVFVGDRQGWCYVGENGRSSINPEACLRSEVSSVQQCDGMTVYTSFGPDPQIYARNPTALDFCLLRPPHLQDIRTSRLHGRALTLGMAQRALHFPNIEMAYKTRSLDTASDVFALHCDEHAVWAGTRSGTVRIFDLRSSQAPAHDALLGRFRASITHIQPIHEHMLLVSALDGSLEIFDTRFIRRAVPVRALAGHVNTVTHNLGISVAPAQDFLYAAGEDNHVRAWSLAPGASLEPLPTPPDAVAYNPFARTFTYGVRAMQAVADVEGGLGSLWVASGAVLQRFELGKRIPEP